MKKSELLKHLESFDDDDDIQFRFDGITLDFSSASISELDREGCIYLTSENYVAEYLDDSEYLEDDYVDDYLPYKDFENYPS